MKLVILHIQTNTKDLRMLNMVQGKNVISSLVSVSLFSLNINEISVSHEQRFLCMAFIVYKVLCMITCLSCIVSLFMPREDRNQLHQSY